jgi:hypothetical protein
LITQYHIYGFGDQASPYKQSYTRVKKQVNSKKQTRLTSRENSQQQDMVVNLQLKVPIMTINQHPRDEQTALISKLISRPTQEWPEKKRFTSAQNEQASPFNFDRDFSYNTTLQQNQTK